MVGDAARRRDIRFRTSNLTDIFTRTKSVDAGIISGMVNGPTIAATIAGTTAITLSRITPGIAEFGTERAIGIDSN